MAKEMKLKKHLEKEKMQVNLKVMLTQEEITENTTKMIRAIREKESLEDTLKAAKETFKAKITDQESRAGKHMRLVQDGYDFRDVECEAVKDFTKGTFTLKRLDTGLIVEERDLHDYEKQAVLIPPPERPKLSVYPNMPEGFRSAPDGEKITSEWQMLNAARNKYVAMHPDRLLQKYDATGNPCICPEGEVTP